MAPIFLFPPPSSAGSVPTFSYILRAIVMGIFAVAIVCALVFFVPRVISRTFRFCSTIAMWVTSKSVAKKQSAVVTSSPPKKQAPWWTRLKVKRTGAEVNSKDIEELSPDAQKWARQLLTAYRTVDAYAVPMPNVVLAQRNPSPPPSSCPPIVIPKITITSDSPPVDTPDLVEDAEDAEDSADITRAVAAFFFGDSSPATPTTLATDLSPQIHTPTLPYIVAEDPSGLKKPSLAVCRDSCNPWSHSLDNNHLTPPPMSWTAPRAKEYDASPLGFTNVSNVTGATFTLSAPPRRGTPLIHVSKAFKVDGGSSRIQPAAPYFWGLSASV